MMAISISSFVLKRDCSRTHINYIKDIAVLSHHITNTLGITLSFVNNCIISAPEDIPKADEIRILIKDIWDIRMAKLRKSVDQMIIRQESHAQVVSLF